MYGNGGVQKDSPVSHICRKDCSPKGIEELASKLKPWGVESSKDTSVRSKALDDQLGQQPPPRNTPESCVTTFLASHPASAVADPSASACEPSSRDRLGIETADQQARRSRCIVGSTLRPNMNSMPAEVQQMIWAEVIRAPACHTFKVKKGAVTEEGSRWSVHLCPGSAREDLDSSAYHQWKSLLSLHNIGFQTAFRRFIKNIQPTPLRLPRCGNSKYKAINFYKTVAAINEEQDLVILEFERGQSLPWFEHTNHRHGMHWQLIQSRMSHFRQVAIHYKHGHMECSHGGAFACLCHTANQPHDCYKACPLTLASFLDLFPNLQQFYFVVEQRLAYHKKFAAAYRGNVCRSCPLEGAEELTFGVQKRSPGPTFEPRSIIRAAPKP